MGDIRARDADRDRYVEVLEAAYADGQLGAEDCELRVSRAQQAETLGELDTITRDLQGRPAPDPAPVPAPVGPARPVGMRPRRSRAGVGAAAAAGAVLLLGLAAFMMPAGMDAATSVDTVESGPVVVGDPDASIAPVEERAGFALTPRDVRAFLRSYESEFGMSEAYEAVFSPRRVSVEVPVRGARPRYEVWTWDGEWTQDTDATAVVGTSGRVDLRDVDARRLLANTETARGALRVEGGRFSHAVLNSVPGDRAEVDIYITNELNESGYLSTTPAGEILRRHPFPG